MTDSSFTVQIDGQYGENDGAIRLMHYGQEIVMWDSQEWIDDPSLVFVIANAIRKGFTEGAKAVADPIGVALTEKDDDEPRYFLELTQCDPPDSPTPGKGHHAGGKAFNDAAEAEAWGRALIGKPVPDEAWGPCCDWQRQDTPVIGALLVDNETRGDVLYAEWTTP